MPTVEVRNQNYIEVEVYCGICGGGICETSTVESTRNTSEISVTAKCPTCEKRIKELEERMES